MTDTSFDADQVAELRRALLDWYERAGRQLPWRVGPADRARGQRPDPYAVWLSEIMLQQTTVPHATPYYRLFLQRWPTVQALAAAERDDILAAWSGLGYYARARKLFECASLVAEAGGEFPAEEDELLALPGIGPYTAAALGAIAFDRPANVVDGNVERVIARLHAVSIPLPKAKNQIRALAAVLADPVRPGDYAQAIMDLGATVCTPTSPDCGQCPWQTHCAARRQNAQIDYPHRAPKKTRPRRAGVAFYVLYGDSLWLRRRPDEGLLGGMMEVPSTVWRGENWTDGEARTHAPFPATWQDCGDVHHVFTHFSLSLKVWRTEAPPDWTPDEGDFYALTDLARLALPTVMRKIVAIGSD